MLRNAAASLLLFQEGMKAVWGAFCVIFTVAVAIAFRVSNQQIGTSAEVTGVAITKEAAQSQSKGELEIAIHRAQRALTEAQEALQEDEWGTSERRYVGEETNQPSDEPGTNTEASERRSNPTIREVHIAKANAAKARLETTENATREGQIKTGPKNVEHSPNISFPGFGDLHSRERAI